MWITTILLDSVPLIYVTAILCTQGGKENCQITRWRVQELIIIMYYYLLHSVGKKSVQPSILINGILDVFTYLSVPILLSRIQRVSTCFAMTSSYIQSLIYCISFDSLPWTYDFSAMSPSLQVGEWRWIRSNAILLSPHHTCHPWWVPNLYSCNNLHSTIRSCGSAGILICKLTVGTYFTIKAFANSSRAPLGSVCKSTI